MSDASSKAAQVTSGLLDGIKSNARLASITGIIMLICGIVAVFSPFVAGLSVTVVVGAMLLVSGISQCFLAFQAGAFGQGLLIFIMGALTTVAGGYMVGQPVSGLAAITLFLAAYFIVTGIFELIGTFQIRGADGWVWMLFNGIITLALGVMIWRQFPVSGAWAVGTLFGIKMVFGGLALFRIGRGVRDAAQDAQAT
jgi:uncharacterized membrane protein HdeD (DUF308 family)